MKMKMSMTGYTLTGVGLGLAVFLLVAIPAPAQEFAFSGDDPVASAEAFGARFSRPDSVPGLPWRWEEPAGSADRVCVDVTRESLAVRSGEIITGGGFEHLKVGSPNKVWWKPLNSSEDMTIQFVSRSMDSPDQSVVFEVASSTPFFTNDRPPQPIWSEAFFPGGAHFPGPGRWIVVATSGSDWGCFIFNIPSEPPAVNR